MTDVEDLREKLKDENGKKYNLFNVKRQLPYGMHINGGITTISIFPDVRPVKLQCLMPIQQIIIRLSSDSLFVILSFHLYLILKNQRDELHHVLCLQWKRG